MKVIALSITEYLLTDNYTCKIYLHLQIHFLELIT